MTEGGGYGTSGSNPQWPVDPAITPPGPPEQGQTGPGQSYGPPNPVPPHGQPTQPGYGQPAYGQPAYGQPAYGQPAYGQSGQTDYSQSGQSGQSGDAQPGHGQPGHGQPGHGQPGHGQPGWPYGFQRYSSAYSAGPVRTSWRRRYWPVVAGAVGILLVLGIGAVFGGSDKNPGSNHTLSAPAQSGSYTKQTGTQADKFASSASTSVIGYSQKDLRVGMYAPPGSAIFEFAFIGLQSSRLADKSAEATIDMFMSGAKVSEPSTVDPGPLGGRMECGASADGQTACVWGDHNTFGALIFFTLRGAAAQDVARAFRGDAEK